MNKKLTLILLVAGLCFTTLGFAETLGFKHYKQGLDYAVEDKFKDAKKEFREALKTDKGNRLSQEALQIIEDFDKRIIDKEFALAQFRAAKNMIDRDFTKALSNFKAALEIMPNSALANNNVGVAYLYLGSYKESVEYFQKALQFDKNYLDAYTNLAYYYNYYLIEPDKAKEYSLQALKVDPDSSGAYADLAHSYYLLGLPKKAIKYYRKALKLDQNDILAYQGLAQCYFAIGKRKEAINNYKKILNLNPEFIDAYFGLGNIYFSMGEKKNAKDAFLKAKELSQRVNDSQRVKLAEQYLEVLP